MAESNHNPTIVAAIIGVIGSISVAIISNWDKLTGQQKIADSTLTQPIAKTAYPPLDKEKPEVIPPTPLIDISGDWYNPAAPTAGGTHIEQQNDSFQFQGWGMLAQGIGYTSKGSGNLIAQTLTYDYTAQYQNGWVSKGNCTGTVTPNGEKITATCTDTIMGTYVSAGVRQ
ncbi:MULTISPECIES: hypothetical protein [Methylomonas]|uniref:Uncharacterized protein n=2 Tax=Methylomonas TaxID=416 RepID=A0A126T8U6_9GAMM|nr:MULTISPECIES: hypothetical protein [Methylomonas]AMK78458.1 hypothetical protein JT25_018500 [Methylomonas denitrificans]OAI04160.1 hypothetical protein A1342_06425 [Methylomonas methanica]TCV87511.1 hypothetical protein EDE11_10212 [Methylomonas methanica]